MSNPKPIYNSEQLMNELIGLYQLIQPEVLKEKELNRENKKYNEDLEKDAKRQCRDFKAKVNKIVTSWHIKDVDLVQDGWTGMFWWVKPRFVEKVSDPFDLIQKLKEIKVPPLYDNLKVEVSDSYEEYSSAYYRYKTLKNRKYYGLNNEDIYSYPKCVNILHVSIDNVKRSIAISCRPNIRYKRFYNEFISASNILEEMLRYMDFSAESFLLDEAQVEQLERFRKYTKYLEE